MALTFSRDLNLELLVFVRLSKHLIALLDEVLVRILLPLICSLVS